MWQPYSSVDHTVGRGRSATSVPAEPAHPVVGVGADMVGDIGMVYVEASKPHSGQGRERTQVQSLVVGLDHAVSVAAMSRIRSPAPHDRLAVAEAGRLDVKTPPAV